VSNIGVLIRKVTVLNRRVVYYLKLIILGSLIGKVVGYSNTWRPGTTR
jgi:hypothetical protein